MSSNPLFTVGHSTHSIEKFLGLLKGNGIKVLVDVRSSPFSRMNPQFNREGLSYSLRSNGIYYLFLGHQLGARRTDPESYRGLKVDYSLVAQTADFKAGVERLRRGLDMMPLAIMCAEQDPLTCHRAVLVAHYSRALFPEVAHILGNGTIETGREADERLLREYSMKYDDMFASRDSQINLAYKNRAEEIAYEEHPKQVAG